ncbi:hypothetical protein HYW53_02965 [Candidatus Giovannonibacteria bacterium]|nr:hypothetical protein [Candidatus Giovannonibacteria bacterium]
MKRTIYLIASTLLGLLLSFIAHAVIEIFYIKYALSNGIQLENQTAFGFGYCVLPLWLQALLLAAGLIGGYLLGRCWWRIVYIEHRHWSFRKK